MKKFVISMVGNDRVMVEALTAREAARIARKNGRNLLKYNGVNSVQFVWNENETEMLYMISTVRVKNRMVSEITNCSHSK